MGESKSNGFKRAFQKTFSSAADNFTLRAGKVEAALAEMDKWVQHMEAQQSPQSQAARASYDALWARLRTEKQKAASGNSNQIKQAFAALDPIKDDARAAMKKGRIDAKRTPFKIDPTNSGQPASVFMSDIPGFYEMGDTADPKYTDSQGQAISEKEFYKQLAAEKIQDGKMVLDSLSAMDDASFDALLESGVRPTPKQVTDLCWYLKSASQEKIGQPWERGALTVPDPKRRLARFMKTSDEGYNRGSSHLKKQQAAVHGQAWGIDFYEGTDEADGKPMRGQEDRFLPNGLNTVLMQEVMTNNEYRLYLKLETEGARLDPGKLMRDRSDKKAGIVRENPPNRPMANEDIKRSIIHGMNLVKTFPVIKLAVKKEGDRDLNTFREKDVDDRVEELYADLCKFAKGRNQVAAKILNNGKGHLFQMFDAMLQVMNTPQLADNDPVLTAAIDRCSKDIKQVMKESSHDDELGSRFGDEVALSMTDIAFVAPPQANGAAPQGGNAPQANVQAPQPAPGGGNAPQPQQGGSGSNPGNGAPGGSQAGPQQGWQRGSGSGSQRGRSDSDSESEEGSSTQPTRRRGFAVGRRDSVGSSSQDDAD